ncbi:hypothetical protein SAMN05216289_10125 [Dokdonella immobilis]|uniref:Uncharacterized protein n=1 Tax=Dokdonella immobilis TaxID=578942 RepID=A0A1I4V193_9GAMM|nr:hypothetical protein SAMN05216289_10125 [Dokdonella immobilis]
MPSRGVDAVFASTASRPALTREASTGRGWRLPGAATRRAGQA